MHLWEQNTIVVFPNEEGKADASTCEQLLGASGAPTGMVGCQVPGEWGPWRQEV